MTAPSSPPIGAVQCPASGVQRGIWLAQLMAPASPAYHIALAYRLAGNLDVVALERAYRIVCNRHESLRGSFHASGQQLHHVIWPAIEPTLRRHDGGPDGTAVDSLVEAEFDLPFDLTEPPLLRVSLVSQGAARHLLLIVAHHLVADADTIELFFDELSAQYNAEVAGAASAPGPGEVGDTPYRDYLAAADAWVRSPRHQAGVAFYRRRLEGYPAAVTLPAPASPRSTWDGAVERRTIDASTTAALAALCGRLHVTPFVLLLTVYGVALHGASGQERVVIGTPVSLRDEPGLERVAGMLVNSVPIPTRWPDDSRFIDAVRATEDAVWDCLDHRRCPFDQLVADLRPPRVGRRNPVFQVMFGFTDGEPKPPLLAGLTATRVPAPARAAKLELTLNAVAHAGTIRLELEWNAGRVAAAAAAELADSLVRVAETAGRRPELTIAALLSATGPQ
jgi:Condensation domain